MADKVCLNLVAFIMAQIGVNNNALLKINILKCQIKLLNDFRFLNHSKTSTKLN